MDLRNARKKAGLTQEGLARLIGVNRATVSKYENGQIEPTLAQMEDIADALGIALWELLPNTLSDAIKFGYENGYFARSEEFMELEKEAESIIAELEAHKNEPRDIDLLAAYRKLNMAGQRIAIERVEELTQIPKYQRTNPDKPLAEVDLNTDTPAKEKPPEGQNNPADGK